MRLDGDISVIWEIEQFIVNHTRYDDVNVSHEPIQPVEISPTNYVKIFLVYVAFYEFDIHLAYDLRNNKGEFRMPDYNSQILLTKYPELSTLLSKMSNIKVSQYTGGKKSIEKINIKETDAQTI